MLSLQLDLCVDKNWLDFVSSPLIIAGPCSAESETQMLDTARGIAQIKSIKAFRAGIWKPRTRPNNFEGVGKLGLPWLQKVKKETGLMVACEVASPHHAELCLKAGVDILWLGARTTVNPFLVQEIADSLAGTDVIVLVKNPVNPDLNLWVGALERVNQAGIKKLIAVHRGFSGHEKSIYRNIPYWSIPIDLKCLLPQLPIICDPSHISGKVDLISHISQKAFDLSMNGLMIETHNNPKVALSDKDQQVTPGELGELLSKIQFTTSLDSSKVCELEEQLLNFRGQIDLLDKKILGVLAARMALIEEIRLLKNDLNMTSLQVQRWNELLNDRLSLGQRLGLDQNFLKHIFGTIHHEALRIQNEHKQFQ